MKEIWKDIPGFEGKYQASTIGRIRSLDRIITVNRNGNTYDSLKKGKILSIWTREHYTSKGYFVKRVRIKNKDWIVSNLIALTFIDNPLNKKEVNHIDSDPTNNNVNNLEWCSRSENIIHSYKHGNKISWKTNYYNISKDDLKYYNLTKHEASKIIGCKSCSINRSFRRGDNYLFGWKIEKFIPEAVQERINYNLNSDK